MFHLLMKDLLLFLQIQLPKNSSSKNSKKINQLHEDCYLAESLLEQKEIQLEQKEIQLEKINNEYLDQAKLATSEVTNAFSAIEKSIPADKKTEISSKISTQLTDIKNGNIPDETKKFLNQI